MLRPFGQDVAWIDFDGKMPNSEANADLIVGDEMLRLLTSNGERWIRLRAVVTESHLFLSKSMDLDAALHRVPLHEVTNISKSKAALSADGDEHGTKKVIQEESSDEMVLIESVPEDTSLVIETAKTGINFGRTYVLRFSSEVFSPTIVRESCLKLRRRYRIDAHFRIQADVTDTNCLPGDARRVDGRDCGSSHDANSRMESP